MRLTVKFNRELLIPFIGFCRPPTWMYQRRDGVTRCLPTVTLTVVLYFTDRYDLLGAPSPSTFKTHLVCPVDNRCYEDVTASRVVRRAKPLSRCAALSRPDHIFAWQPFPIDDALPTVRSCCSYLRRRRRRVVMINTWLIPERSFPSCSDTHSHSGPTSPGRAASFKDTYMY